MCSVRCRMLYGCKHGGSSKPFTARMINTGTHTVLHIKSYRYSLLDQVRLFYSERYDQRFIRKPYDRKYHDERNFLGLSVVRFIQIQAATSVFRSRVKCMKGPMRLQMSFFIITCNVQYDYSEQKKHTSIHTVLPGTLHSPFRFVMILYCTMIQYCCFSVQ